MLPTRRSCRPRCRCPLVLGDPAETEPIGLGALAQGAAGCQLREHGRAGEPEGRPQRGPADRAGGGHLQQKTLRTPSHALTNDNDLVRLIADAGGVHYRNFLDQGQSQPELGATDARCKDCIPKGVGKQESADEVSASSSDSSSSSSSSSEAEASRDEGPSRSHVCVVVLFVCSLWCARVRVFPRLRCKSRR